MPNRRAMDRLERVDGDALKKSSIETGDWRLGGKGWRFEFGD